LCDWMGGATIHKEWKQYMRTRSLRSTLLTWFWSWVWDYFETSQWQHQVCIWVYRYGAERRGPSLRSRSKYKEMRSLRERSPVFREETWKWALENLTWHTRERRLSQKGAWKGAMEMERRARGRMCYQSKGKEGVVNSADHCWRPSKMKTENMHWFGNISDQWP
jgi:hypothetical protein